MYFKYLLLVVSLAYCACDTNNKSTADSSSTTTSTQDINLEAMDALLKSNKTVVLLDVRTPAEVQGGIIPGAINIDFRNDNFQEELGKLSRDETYLVYCKSGGRSSKTGKMMEQLEFKSIYNLLGGYTAYAERK